MARFNCYNYSHMTSLVLALLIQICSQPVASGSSSSSVVEFLPGFRGRLPFHLETGYVGVGEEEEVQVFYYFIKSENNPEDDPILIWLQGGPGCSSFGGLVNEIGPIAFPNQVYNGSLPGLLLRPPSWTKVSNIIFPDLPVGTGFTYAKTEAAKQSSDSGGVRHADQFLRKWLMDHPEYLSHKMYLCGESYSGITIPALFQEISHGNENGIQPWINIQGYILGNPLTTRHEENYQIPFAHGMGLISDELYELTAEIDPAMILEPAFCGYDLRVLPPRISLMKRSLSQKVKDPNFPSKCRRLGYLQARHWANNDHVRKALHVRKGTTGEWMRCNRSLPYKQDIHSSFYIHANLSTKGYRSLIYSGDHDMGFPFLSTQAWIRSLNYSIIDDWRPWHVNHQVAGYTRTYSNRMTYATVKGAGHSAPEFKPEECLAMLKRWIANEPL
ncbi:serine carboxypeptidase-like 2 isoform X2 [Neltuma alba]|uniref:serine carboxypeptidase-like 2 isoform X2 n=1 Tax=Neltuma alba TaxID=207710 RepID=UPI0010A2EF26|nr:serine carboxypeptidase-like 2 isoform X2 [Prosopis alba]